MKRFYIDTNIISSPAVIEKIKISHHKDKVFVIDEVLKEVSEENETKINNIPLTVLPTKHEHLIELTRIWPNCSLEDGLKLIDLFNNKGSADMLLIAHAVVENKMIPPTLPFVDDRFVVQHIIVTHDRGIIDLARKIGIETMNQEVFLKNM